MQAALAAEPALGTDETPVDVLTPDNDPADLGPGNRLPLPGLRCTNLISLRQ
jgi:hypothetical protein